MWSRQSRPILPFVPVFTCCEPLADASDPAWNALTTIVSMKECPTKPNCWDPDAIRDRTDPIKGKRPIDILIEMYIGSPRFAECVQVMLDAGATIGDPLLRALLLDDDVGLRGLLAGWNGEHQEETEPLVRLHIFQRRFATAHLRRIQLHSLCPRTDGEGR